MNSFAKQMAAAGTRFASCSALIRAVAGNQHARAICMSLITIFLLAFLSGSLPAQSTSESTIKIHGGSMTFFSEAEWKETAPGSEIFCSKITPRDQRQLHLQGFFPEGERRFRRREESGLVPLTSFDWSLELRGHSEEEARTRQFTVSDEGIRLEASPKDCTGAAAGGPSVRIRPLPGSHFYKDQLLPGGSYSANQRFLSDCSRENADRCERVAEVRVFDRDPKTPTRVFTCPNGACAAYVGRLKAGPTPTVLVGGRSTAPPPPTPR